MNKLLLFVCSVITFTSFGLKAQGVKDFYTIQPESPNHFAIRAGANYSITTVSATLTPFTTHLMGVTPKTGFYVGGTYFKNIVSDKLSFRLDATFQNKGVASTYNGQLARTSSYYYLGVTPSLGLAIAKNVTMYAGVEVNQQIRSLNPWGEGSPVEFGTSIRANYALGRWRAEVSYFKGLTKYNQLDLTTLGATKFYFFNQNVQAGLLYTIGRKEN